MRAAAHRVERHEAARADPAATGPALSPREREIVRLVAAGHATRQIGAILDISPWTVSSHLRRLFAKYRVRTRAALVAAVLQSGPAPRDPFRRRA